MPFCPQCGGGVSGAVCENCGAAQVPLAQPPGNAPVTLVAQPADDFSEVLGNALRDAWALLVTNKVAAAAIIGAGTLAGTVTMFAMDKPVDRFNGVSVAFYFVAMILVWFAIAAAVRTLHPEFRMTVGIWLATAAYNIAAALLTLVAALAFVIPGFWVGTKLVLAPYVYCLDPQSNVLERAWNITTGKFWETFGLQLIVGIITMFPMIAGLGVMALAMTLPITGLILFPIGLLAVAWALHMQALALVQWSHRLLNSAQPTA